MLKFDYITKEHISNQPKVPDDPSRILIVGSYGS